MEAFGLPWDALDEVPSLAYAVAAVSLLAVLWLWRRRHPVYLIDLACFVVPDRLKMSRTEVMRRVHGKVDEAERSGAVGVPRATADFMDKLMAASGLGDETGLSDPVMAMLEPGGSIARSGHQEILAETEMVIFAVVADLLKKTGTQPSEIDVVITTCSCFAPTPSMAAMLVNRFKMRRNVLTYSLAGMGCSSSLVSVDMAKHLLKALPNSRVLVVNHENITNCWYSGADKSFALVNCLFRLGGAAALLTNRPADAWRAKYELLHSVRTHLGADDDAFSCMGNGEDDNGMTGVFLRRNVVEIAGRALKHNLTTLAPRVLPYTELVRCALDKTYVPGFNRAFSHFLLHTGGRGVLDAMKKKLDLSDPQMAHSVATLKRFGNTSAASTWYILANVEQTKGIRRGERLWQLGFGGGFKANSAVWRARRTFREDHACWA